MPNLRRTFVKGRMEKDIDERLIPDGLYSHAENILVLDSENSDAGAVQNSLSNRQLTNIDFGANPITLGTTYDETNKKIYWAVKSDTGCYFVEYDAVKETAVKVLEDTRPVVERVLNWKEDFLITAMDKVISSEAGKDLMIINDDNLQPLCFNIERAKKYGVNSFEKEDIFLIKKPPRFAPKVTPAFIDEASNYIEDKFLSFSYRYKYLDGEYSALSSFSNYVFYPKPFNLEYEVMDNIGMLNMYNALKIVVNTGDKRVTDIQCVVKYSNSNNLYLIQSFNKKKEAWGDNQLQNFTFSNNKVYTVLPEKEIYRACDNVPLKAKAQTIIGNLLVMGNFLEGYNITDVNGKRFKIDYTVGINSNKLESKPTSSTINGDILTLNLAGLELNSGASINILTILKSKQATPMQFSGNFPFLLQKNYANASELAQDKDFIDFVEKYMTQIFSEKNKSIVNNGTAKDPAPFKISSSTTTTISIKAPVLNFEVTTIVTPANTQANPPTPAVTTTKTETVEWVYQNSSKVSFLKTGSIASLKTNRSVEVGIIYMDEFNRSTTVLTYRENTVYVKPENIDSINKLQITIKSPPPAFADRYKIVVKQAKLDYQTIYSMIAYKEGELFAWIKLDGDNFDKVKVGDNLIFKSDKNGTVKKIIKAKVLEAGKKEKDFIKDNKIKDKDGKEIDVSELEGNYIKIKTPFGISLENRPGDIIQHSAESSENKDGRRFYIDIGPFPGEIKQGSKIDINISNWFDYDDPNKNAKPFSKTYFANETYATFKLWYDAEVNGELGAFKKNEHGDINENKVVGKDDTLRVWCYSTGTTGTWGMHSRWSYLNGTVTIMQSSLIILETEEKKSANDEIYYETEQTFEIKNNCHQGNAQNQEGNSPAIIDLDFYNCFNMGNGAESYIIKDAFNKDYLNIDLRPSTTSIEEYKAVRRFSDITFSEPFLESSNINGLNSFNLALGNFKELDKQYGSIQKLFARDNDILVLKERKASKVMFQKDMLYSPDGSSNLSAINKTLGSEVPYLGSNGIGKHPESFAENNYQIYYANPEQGEITRLSMDGTNAITTGMVDWFRDIMRNQPNAKMLGGYDGYSKQYVFSIGEEPDHLLRLSCSNEITKYKQEGSFSYELKLNDLAGDIVINYNITEGMAAITANFDGAEHKNSNVKGVGSLSFKRTSLTENIVLVTITAVSKGESHSKPVVSYSVANICPVGHQLKIVSIILNDKIDIKESTSTKFKWGDSPLYSNEDDFTDAPISKFFAETGVEGEGRFPLNGSVVTMQSYKGIYETMEFSLDKANRMGYLVSSKEYAKADINSVLQTATFLKITSEDDNNSKTKTGNFLFKRLANEILYLIWDYRNRKIVARDDSASFEFGKTKNINILQNDTIGGQPATLDNVTVTQVSSSNANLSLSGASVNTSSLPAGTHTLVYRITDKTDPANYDEATFTVEVTALRTLFWNNDLNDVKNNLKILKNGVEVVNNSAGSIHSSSEPIEVWDSIQVNVGDTIQVISIISSYYNIFGNISVASTTSTRGIVADTSTIGVVQDVVVLSSQSIGNEKYRYFYTFQIQAKLNYIVCFTAQAEH